MRMSRWCAGRKKPWTASCAPSWSCERWAITWFRATFRPRTEALGVAGMHLETRVLVTGGAGFLGSHLCDRLLNGGAGVLCVDNYFTGTRRALHSPFDPHPLRL